MNDVVEIYFKNGRIRVCELSAYVSAEPFGINLMTEIDLRFDDLAEGLIAEVGFHRPEPGAGGGEGDTDPRGESCFLVRSAYIKLLDCEDMNDIDKVCYRGNPVLRACGDEIVVLSRLNSLCALYLADDAIEGLMCTIATLYPILAGAATSALEEGDANRCDTQEKRDEQIAAQMGVTPTLLMRAREFMAEEAEEAEDLEAEILEPKSETEAADESW